MPRDVVRWDIGTEEEAEALAVKLSDPVHVQSNIESTIAWRPGWVKVKYKFLFASIEDWVRISLYKTLNGSIVHLLEGKKITGRIVYTFNSRSLQARISYEGPRRWLGMRWLRKTAASIVKAAMAKKEAAVGLGRKVELIPAHILTRAAHVGVVVFGNPTLEAIREACGTVPCYVSIYDPCRGRLIVFEDRVLHISGCRPVAGSRARIYRLVGPVEKLVVTGV